MLNGQNLLSLLAVGYALATWGGLVLPSAVTGLLGWVDAGFCAKGLVLLTVYLNVLKGPLARALGAVKGSAGLVADAAAGAVKDVASGADLP